jgi:adenosylhomocysteine nucleosidase
MSDLTLITFAVREESEPFRERVGDRTEMVWRLTGMGPRNAERVTRQALKEHEPRLVLTCGFAGGLNPSLPAGTVIFDAEPASGLNSVLTGLGAYAARFLTVDRVITTVAEKRSLWRRAGADAVEMESGIVRSLCREQGIPSATVRVISDAAAEDLPLDFNRLVDEDWHLSRIRLAIALLGSPTRLPALVRFGRQTRAAAERLAEVLAALIADRTWLAPPSG